MIETLRVGDQQIAQVLARGEDLQQDGQCLGIALKEGAHGQGISPGRDVIVQIVQRHVGIGATAQVCVELIAQLGQQIERHPAGRHPHQHAMPPLHVGQSQIAQPHGRGMRIVQVLAKGRGVHGEEQWVVDGG